MGTYYTVNNFLVYFLAVTVILVLIPLIVVRSDRNRPLLFRLTLRLLVLSAVTWPLSRTCPYPVVTVFLRWGSLLSGGAGTAAGLGTAALVLAGRCDDPLRPTADDFDRWATGLLQGSYLVIDPGGLILGGHLRNLEGLPSPGDKSFREYFALLDGGGQGVPEGEGEGSIQREGKTYRWTFTALGGEKREGFLFALQDLTGEHRLLEERLDREKILFLRSERIGRQGKLRAREEKIRYRGEGIRRSTEAVKASLNRLILCLSEIRETGAAEDDALERAVRLGTETMGNIRETVHNMSTGEIDT